MKAWEITSVGNVYKNIVFADTHNEAKKLYKSQWFLDNVDYTDIRVKRAKYADDCENLSKKELIVLCVNNGWWWDLGDYHIDYDNLNEMMPVLDDIDSKGLLDLN